jgi:hypothetical protein
MGRRGVIAGLTRRACQESAGQAPEQRRGGNVNGDWLVERGRPVNRQHSCRACPPPQAAAPPPPLPPQLQQRIARLRPPPPPAPRPALRQSGLSRLPPPTPESRPQVFSNSSVSSGVGVYWMFYTGGDFSPLPAPQGLPGAEAGAEVEGLRMRPGLAMSQVGAKGGVLRWGGAGTEEATSGCVLSRVGLGGARVIGWN